MMKGKKIVNSLRIKQMLALCLCAVMLAGIALAEPSVEIAGGGIDDSLCYECTLPDGRLLLSGSKTRTGTGYEGMKTWLVCLNADFSLSWEYLEQEEGDFQAPYATLLADGTIAVACRRFRGEDDKIVAKFFTQDGRPTGGETVIPAEGESLWVQEADPAFLMLERQVCEDGETEWRSRMEILNWDGSEIERYSPEEMNDGFFYMDKEEDGVLVYGEDPEKRAIIMKKDSLQGTVLWECVLDHETPETEEALLYDVLKTEDGGYAALVMEYTLEPFAGKIFLVKLDAEGRLQWTKKENAGSGEQFLSMKACGGKIVICASLEETPETDLAFHWLDLQGNDLGTTELALKPEDFPALDTKQPTVSYVQMIPAEDSLRALVCGKIPEDPGPDEGSVTVHDFIIVTVGTVPSTEE